jgi:hypothetical protein
MSDTAPAVDTAPSSAADPAATSARDEAIARLKGRRAFRAAVVSYLIGNLFFWGIWALSGPDGGGVPWPLWITGFGALGLIGQAWHTFGQQPIREADIAKEMQRGA